MHWDRKYNYPGQKYRQT